MGLAQAHGIVALHNGHITVESELGAGTAFTIYLPAMVATENTSSNAGTQALLPLGQGERVLVVEDDTAVCASILELLETCNDRVT